MIRLRDNSSIRYSVKWLRAKVSKVSKLGVILNTTLVVSLTKLWAVEQSLRDCECEIEAQRFRNEEKQYKFIIIVVVYINSYHFSIASQPWNYIMLSSLNYSL
jgi:hypothetical protein